MYKLITITFSFILFCELILAQQTITSSQDGNFSDMLSWDCNCVPGGGDSIIVNHEIVQDMNVDLNNGFMQIGANGSLITDELSRSISLYHSGFINYGTLITDYLELDSVIVMSTGAIKVNKRYIQKDNKPIIIDGSFTVEDTLWLTYATYLKCNGYLSAGTIYLQGRLLLNNSGECNTLESHYDFQLMGTDNNFTIRSNMLLLGGSYDILASGSTTVQNSVYNSGVLYLNPDATLNINNSLYNGDTISPNGDLICDRASVKIMGDMINHHYIMNGGCISVANYSASHGYFYGNGDFCDATGGYIDLNTGVMDTTITFCNPSCRVEDSTINNLFKLYPNPFHDYFMIESEISNAEIVIYNSLGQKVILYKISSTQEIINAEFINSGLYYFHFYAAGNLIYEGKIIKE